MDKNLKIPPQALELEEIVLGAIMIDQKGLYKIIDILSPEMFYNTKHKEIYRVILQLFHNSEPIDLYTISNKLRQLGKIKIIGDEYYLIKLTQKVVSSAHIEYHSSIIKYKFILRSLINISYEIIEKSYDETTDIFELLDYAESKFFEITYNNLSKKKFEHVQSIILESIDKMKKIASLNNNGLSGIPSGFSKIDDITSGWQNSELIIFAARPGMGKTAFILSMANNISVYNKIPIAFFSLEMSSIQLINRLIAYQTDLSINKLKKANLSDLEWKLLNQKIKKIEQSPFYIDDTPALSIFDLRSKSRILVSQYGVRLIMIDYLQLMTCNKNTINREQEISIISRSLKSIAKELNIPIIAISQLSRAVESRGGNKRPLLSDLRESGAIEQDADIVSFIYRPEYYGFNTDTCKDQAEIIIAKHRNGKLDNIRLRFIKNKAQFLND
ncbi:MAG: replicative DNA helicase [Candidatus Bostrichicola ureolyticus]|nr:MAG: replicative DNA helicase [Candidatus Bostrichicola ureolyticus]